MSALLLESASSTSSASNTSRAALWTGRIATALGVLFLVFDITVKLFLTPEAITASAQLGFTAAQVTTIGIIGIVCLILYLIPRTAPLGAILWTGYFGGAIAIQFRAGNPLFTFVLFPIYIAALLWVGLYFRDARVRGLIRARS
jgi:hypothetical protein